jgi:hypothetical protein
MPTYVLRDGGFVDKRTGEPLALPERDGLCAPRVISDLPAYRSPIDGKMVDGRSARREDLKRNGCVEAGDIKPLNNGLARNEKFARKHGLKHEKDA